MQSNKKFGLELRNIASANRHNKDHFPNDTEFADWAQSRARFALNPEPFSNPTQDGLPNPSIEDISAEVANAYERGGVAEALKVAADKTIRLLRPHATDEETLTEVVNRLLLLQVRDVMEAIASNLQSR